MEQFFIPRLEKANLSPKDSLHTLVEHFAIQIASVIRTYSTPLPPRILLTGGGAYNCYFVERLAHHLDQHWIQVEAGNALIEFKEALVFAFLGLLKLRGEVNTLASVTGASQNSSWGTVYG